MMGGMNAWITRFGSPQYSSASAGAGAGVFAAHAASENAASTMMARLTPLACQCLVEVRDQVIDRFYADRQADERIANT